MKYGAFINPSPKSLSDLINDNNYMSIREYILDTDSLKGNSANAGSSIVRVSLNVKTPFVSPNSVNIIEVVSDTNQVLLSSAANDPAIANNYISECSYITSGNDNEVLVKHNLSGMTAGLAILRIELYENINDYEPIATSDSKDYNTMDQNTVDATIDT